MTEMEANKLFTEGAKMASAGLEMCIRASRRVEPAFVQQLKEQVDQMASAEVSP